MAQESSMKEYSKLRQEYLDRHRPENPNVGQRALERLAREADDYAYRKLNPYCDHWSRPGRHLDE